MTNAAVASGRKRFDSSSITKTRTGPGKSVGGIEGHLRYSRADPRP